MREMSWWSLFMFCWAVTFSIYSTFWIITILSVGTSFVSLCVHIVCFIVQFLYCQIWLDIIQKKRDK